MKKYLKKNSSKHGLTFFFYFLQNNGHLSTQRARNNMVGISCWNSPMILCQNRNLVTCHLWILSRTDPIQTKPSFPFLQVYPLRTGLLALLNLPHLRFVFTPTYFQNKFFIIWTKRYSGMKTYRGTEKYLISYLSNQFLKASSCESYEITVFV